MGGGAKPENLLIILPFKEPTEAINRIQKKHPNIKVNYRSLLYGEVPWKEATDPPKGWSKYSSYILMFP